MQEASKTEISSRTDKQEAPLLSEERRHVTRDVRTFVLFSNSMMAYVCCVTTRFSANNLIRQTTCERSDPRSFEKNRSFDKDSL